MKLKVHSKQGQGVSHWEEYKKSPKERDPSEPAGFSSFSGKEEACQYFCLCLDTLGWESQEQTATDTIEDWSLTAKVWTMFVMNCSLLSSYYNNCVLKVLAELLTSTPTPRYCEGTLDRTNSLQSVTCNVRKVCCHSSPQVFSVKEKWASRPEWLLGLKQGRMVEGTNK